MKSLLPPFLLIALSWNAHAVDTVPFRLQSPDNELAIEVTAAPDVPLQWTVAWRGKTLLAPAELGLILSDGHHAGGHIRSASASFEERDESWEPLYGERSSVHDHYRAMTLHLQDDRIKMNVTFRAYNEGVALSYMLPRQPGLDEVTITRDHTTFQFAGDHPCYAVYSAQGEYEEIPLSKLNRHCERPLTVTIADNVYAAIGEARLVDFARMRLNPVGGHPYAVRADLQGTATVTTPYTTPWRFLLVASSPGKLLENNFFVENLNDPCAIEDTSWIKPGTVIREVTLTTSGGKACVDFAVERGMQYIEFDAGWYGHEHDPDADARTVSVDPKRSKGPLDLQEVINYGKARGIGVWLYVNRRHLETQLDDILPLYQSWGIAGVKYGFVQVGTQEWTTWLHEAIRKAAEHKLMVDVHDEYRPTGYSRTYPNFLTQEGIRGNEEMPTAAHNCILPFTRMLSGAGDYTHCLYTARIKTTRAHQLGSAIVFYSPLQFLYWYDRPGAFKGEPELAFWDHLPTTWEVSKVLSGVIGDHIVMARQTAETWYLGGLNGNAKKALRVDLSFLPDERTYTATIHQDADPTGGAPTRVLNDTRTVTRDDILNLDCAHNGGFAIRLEPAS